MIFGIKHGDFNYVYENGKSVYVLLIIIRLDNIALELRKVFGRSLRTKINRKSHSLNT
jgi:hypothetical protein